MKLLLLLNNIYCLQSSKALHSLIKTSIKKITETTNTKKQSIKTHSKIHHKIKLDKIWTCNLKKMRWSMTNWYAMIWRNKINNFYWTIFFSRQMTNRFLSNRQIRITIIFICLNLTNLFLEIFNRFFQNQIILYNFIIIRERMK